MGFQPLWGFDVQGKERGLLTVSLKCRDPKPYTEREESSPGSRFIRPVWEGCFSLGGRDYTAYLFEFPHVTQQRALPKWTDWLSGAGGAAWSLTAWVRIPALSFSPGTCGRVNHPLWASVYLSVQWRQREPLLLRLLRSEQRLADLLPLCSARQALGEESGIQGHQTGGCPGA